MTDPGVVDEHFTPQAAPMRYFRRRRDVVEQAFSRVLEGDHAILGPELEAFEAAFSRYCGMAHCIGVGSGTEALHIALRAAGVGPGDEVVTVALTAAGTAQAISLCGATPVFVDVDPVTRCMDPDAAHAAIGPRTAAIVPVHLYGYPADIRPLADLAEKNGLFLLEDCAQAHGARRDGRHVGSLSHAAAFSFYPTKNLGCIGDGGAVLTGDAALAARLRSLRAYGWDGPERVSMSVAGNSRLDEAQAAILSALLPFLDEENARRRTIADVYRDRLDGAAVMPPDHPGAVWHQFAIEHRRRDELAGFLLEAGIGTAVHYTPPLHFQPAFQSGRRPDLPVTERLSAQLLSLPIQADAVGGHTGRITDAVLARANACPM